MIVVDVLLALNLILFVVVAIRAPRPTRPSIDELVAAARATEPSGPPALVPAKPVDNVVPFRSREELRLVHARQLHPSSHAH